MATQGDAMRHLVHSVICGLVAMLVTVSGAHADTETAERLRTEYISGSWGDDGVFDEIRNSDLPLPECSAMWEVYLVFQSLGPTWMDFVFPNAGGDPHQILVNDAIDFCARQFGAHRDTLEEICPCSIWCYTDDDLAAGQMAAARGCAMLLTSLSPDNGYDNPFSGFMDIMITALANDEPISEDDAAMFFCTGNDSGYSDFWGSLDYSLDSCQANVMSACGMFAGNCERTAEIIYVMTSFYQFYGDGRFRELYDTRDELYEVLCLRNLSDFPMFGSDPSTCIQYVDTIMDNLGECWDGFIGGYGGWWGNEEEFLQALMDVQYMTYADLEAAGYSLNNRYDDDAPAAGAIINELLQQCSDEYPDAGLVLCPGTCDLARCEREWWGTYACNSCGDYGGSSGLNGYVADCSMPYAQTRSGSDNSGTYTLRETCNFFLDGLWN